MNNIFYASDAKTKSRRKHRFGCPSHIWFCMKLTIFLSLLLTIHVSASTMAQKVNLQVKDASFRTVMNTVQQQTGYSFVAREALLKVAKPISIDIRSKDVAAVLPLLFEGQPFTYQVNGKVITLTEHNETKPVKTEAPVRKEAVQQVIRGKVTGEDGNPLTGVSVQIKGTSTGTSTDLYGNYSITIPAGEIILVFSRVGFITQEVPAQDKNNVSIVLIEEDRDLEEVVVVAYGTQRKKEVVGAMTSINPSELKIPSSNLTTALAGRLAGVIAYQRSGEPGQDNADFFIRGVTTFGYKKDPLILIDGVEFS